MDNAIVLCQNLGYLGKLKKANEYCLLRVPKKTHLFPYLLKMFTKMVGNFPAVADQCK